MTKNPSDKDIKSDEIDLIELFRKMGKTISGWLSGLIQFILISIIYLIKRWIPLSFSLAAGILLTVLLKATIPPVYSADIALRSNTISSTDMIAYINRLHSYTRDKNRKAVSDALSLAPDIIAGIKDIRAYWIIDKGHDNTPDEVDYLNNHNIYDTVNVRMQDRLDIRVKIKSPEKLPQIRKGILNFINSDSLYQQKNKLRLRLNNDLLVRLNYDILQLDSLQKVKYFEETRNRQAKTGSQMIFLQEQKTQLVYGDIYELYKRKQGLETERDLYPGIITVLSEFTISTRRDNGFKFFGRIVIPAAIIVTILILIFISNRKKIREVYRKY
jgi:hypothetical protein